MRAASTRSVQTWHHQASGEAEVVAYLGRQALGEEEGAEEVQRLTLVIACPVVEGEVAAEVVEELPASDPAWAEAEEVEEVVVLRVFGRAWVGEAAAEAEGGQHP